MRFFKDVVYWFSCTRGVCVVAYMPGSITLEARTDVYGGVLICIVEAFSDVRYPLIPRLRLSEPV